MDQEKLQMVEQQLLRERARSLRSFEMLLEDAGRHRDSTDAGLSGWPQNGADQAARHMELETSLLLTGKEGRYLHRIEDALRRLYGSPSTFGTCMRCGTEIPFERLLALPHVRFCLECKLREEGAA